MNRKARRSALKLPPGMVAIPLQTIYFPSAGDPEGKFHVAQKWMEAKAMCDLMVVALARSGISIDLLDLPGASKVLEAHAIANGLETFPGPSVVKMAVEGIRETRAMFEAPKADVITPPANEAQAPAPQVESAVLH